MPESDNPSHFLLVFAPSHTANGSSGFRETIERESFHETLSIQDQLHSDDTRTRAHRLDGGYTSLPSGRARHVDRDGNLVADGTGTASHLGRFALHRTATLKTNTDGELEVDGQATLTAANRDQLEASIKGTLNPQTGKAVLTYEWTRGTGRFQNVSGTTVWLVQVNPPDPPNPDQTYDVVADGVINY